MMQRVWPLLFAVSWLVLSIVLVVTLFEAYSYFSIFPYRIYTNYPKVAFASLTMSVIFTGIVFSRIRYGGIKAATLLMLFASIVVSAYGWFAASFRSPIHQSAINYDDRVYYLAIDPLLDVGNPYYVYACETGGVICWQVFTGAYFHEPDTQLSLAINTQASTFEVVNNKGEVVGTYQIP